MTNGFYTFLLFSSLLTVLTDKCSVNPSRIFDTAPYHEKTLELNKTMYKLDSLSLAIGTNECFDTSLLTSLKAEYVDFCYKLETYEWEDSTLLTVNDCVIKSDQIRLKSVKWAMSVKEEFEAAKIVLNELQQHSDSLKKVVLKNCGKYLDRCKSLIRNGENKKFVNEIKLLVSYGKLTDAQIYRDSVTIKKNLPDIKKMIPGKGTERLLELLIIALTNDVKYRLSHQTNREYCNSSHIRWSEIEEFILNNSRDCAKEYIEEISGSKDWAVIIDSTWMMEQVNRTRKCALKPRGCKCEAAMNYDSIAVKASRTCIGCMDEKAENYCEEAIRQDDFPCKYNVCNDPCFEEYFQDNPIDSIKIWYPKYVSSRDELVHVVDSCSLNICGCMNPCAENYDSLARKSDPDLCIGEICGCLDSTAVNYAYRKGPKWLDKKYPKTKVTKHDKDLCIYSGCMNECAINYDPLAIKHDNSCICDSTSIQELERMKSRMGIKAGTLERNPSVLREEFLEIVGKDLAKTFVMDMRQVDLNLMIDLEFKAIKINSGMTSDGIPLGEYNFLAVNQTIDALILYLENFTPLLLDRNLHLKIVGEADANPIRGKGIEYKNPNGRIRDRNYKILSPSTSTALIDINQSDYDLKPNAGPMHLNPGDRIYRNIDLAFLRAYMAEQKFRMRLSEIDESKMFIGVKANTQKGKEYRRVGIAMQLDGFFEHLNEAMLNTTNTIKDIDEAIEFYRTHGEPTSTKTYSECPCISRRAVTIPIK